MSGSDKSNKKIPSRLLTTINIDDLQGEGIAESKISDGNNTVYVSFCLFSVIFSFWNSNWVMSLGKVPLAMYIKP